MSCGVRGVNKVTIDKRYVIANDNTELVFWVNEIIYEIDADFSEKRIGYFLYNPEKSSPSQKTSYIKYKRTRMKNKRSRPVGNNLLERIEGSQSIRDENINFTWSYGSKNHIYLYLEDRSSVRELNE